MRYVLLYIYSITLLVKKSMNKVSHVNSARYKNAICKDVCNLKGVKKVNKYCPIFYIFWDLIGGQRKIV